MTTTTNQPEGWPTQPLPASHHRARKVVIAIAASIAGLLLVGVILGISNQAATSGSQPGMSQGLGSANATKDIDGIRMSQPDAIGVRSGHVKLTNNSKGTSDYSIELRILSSSGTNLGTTYATANRVEPGQMARAEFMVTESGADRVEVTKVQRTASN
jgi:hypothetical protein